MLCSPDRDRLCLGKKPDNAKPLKSETSPNPVYNNIDEKNTENIKAEEMVNTPTTTVTEKGTPAPSESKNICGEFSIENLWLINPDVPEEIIGLGAFPIKIKVVSEEEALFLSDNRHESPSTPYKIELLDAYNNLDDKTNIDTIYLSGGDVTVEEIIARMDQETIVKFGFDKYSESERKTTYLSYVSDYDCKLIPGEEYIVLANKDEYGHYYISCIGYGVFKRDSSNVRANVYKNVITDVEFKID